MGQRHLEAIRRMGLAVAGAFDVNSESLELAAREQGVPAQNLWSNLDDFYAAGRPDCVVIATTADSHCRLVCDAAERGVKYILVEKPMATSLAECDTMIATCARHGAHLSVNHQMRFMEQYTEARRIVMSDECGGLSSMTVVGGNFGLAMIGTHFFEAFRFLTNEPITEVTAWLSRDVVPNPRGAQFEDRAGSVRGTTESGKRVYMEAGPDQGHGIRVIYGCRHGLVTVDGLAGRITVNVREAGDRALPTTRYGTPSKQETFEIRPAEVVDSTVAVLNALFTSVNAVTGEHGRSALEVLVAAHESSERGSVPVKVGVGADRSRTYPWA